MVRRTLLLLSSLSLATHTFSQDISLTITGDIPSPVHMSGSDLAALPHRSVTLNDTHHGTQGTYQGVPLIEILKRAGAPAGKDLKGKTMSTYVLAKAKDDYQVVFSLAELDPGIRDTEIIIADGRDGKALEASEGPIRLIDASDKKPARSVRMLTELQIVQVRK